MYTNIINYIIIYHESQRNSIKNAYKKINSIIFIVVLEVS